MNKRTLNNVLFFIEVSVYIICIIVFTILSMYDICSKEIASIIYSVFMIISFGYLLLLEFVFKKYDNAVHYKMFEKYYIPNNGIRRKSYKRKGLIGVIILWIFYLIFIAIIRKLGYLSWQLYLIGASIIFIFNSIFTRKTCLLSVLFMHNEANCCKNCGINCWDYLIFASALVFAPRFNLFTRILNIVIIVISLAMMILWEYNYHKYPYRFYPETNKALECRNCLKQCKYKKAL